VPEVYPAAMKAQCNEGGGEILLGRNIGGGAVTPRPVRFQCVGAWISIGLPSRRMYTQLRIAQNSTCAGRSRT